MSRPQAGKRRTASHPRRIIGAFVVFALAIAALIAMPQAASAADVVAVPDANFRAVLNSAIASATGTTRTADQTITTGDAATVTSIESYGDGTAASVDDFTGVQAFPNLTSVSVYNAGDTISLAPFAGTPIQSLALVPVDAGTADFTGTISSDMSALGSMSKLNSLFLAYYSLPDATLRTLPQVPSLTSLTLVYDEITDVTPLAKLASLADVTLEGNEIQDLSPIATIAGVGYLSAPYNRVSDLGFLTGMTALRELNLGGNRIEDVSPLATLTDKTKYKLNFGNQSINLSENRVADLSPLVGFFGGPSLATYSQSVFVGPYQDGGVTIKLRGIRDNAPTSINPADAGTYNAGTNRLISNDPTAPFIDVVSGTAQAYQDWKVFFSEAPDKLAALKLNEIESNGDTVNGDWAELYNPASRVLDLGGLVIADNDNTHKIILPVGTKIPAKGYKAIRTDDPAVTGQFGLGSADSVRIFAPGTTDLTTTPIDAYSWTAHAATTYGRTVPGAGKWATTSGGTFGAVNAFATAATVTLAGDATSTSGSASLTATVAKPDGTGVATDATGTVVFAVDGKDASGAVAVTAGKADWTATGLTGSPAGIAHKITARYVAKDGSDPYDSSVPSPEFTVTVTIGEFAGTVTLSTSTPQVCQTIGSDISAITPAPDSVTYQWQQKTGSQASPWTDVPAATGASHALAFAVADGKLIAPSYVARRLVATASKAGYATKTFASAETASVEPAPFLTKPAATLSTSTPKVGETITATHPKWSSCIPADLNFEIGYDYQWLRDGQPISGATDSVANGIGGAGPKKVSYTLTSADAGHKISLRVLGNAPGMSYDRAESAETSAVTAGAFVTSPAPVVDNTSPKVGDKLTASTAAWSPVATMAYQWLRDGQPISGATTASYTTTAADADHALSVKATGTADGYAATDKTSTATAKVARLAFTASPSPVIGGGTPTVGDTLTATVAAWAPVASFTWQWLRDGQPIDGATAASYTTTAVDQGHAISVRVTGTVDGYESTARTSAATPAVVAKPAPGVTQVNRSVSSKYTVKVTAQSGRKLRLIVSAKGVPASLIDKRITVKVAGVKGTYLVTVRNGKATVSLGSRAKALKKGKKYAVTLTLAKLTASASTTAGDTRTTTTYTVAKATEKVKVRLK